MSLLKNPKFKVGDRVVVTRRVCDESVESQEVPVGAIGTIIDVDIDWDFPYDIEFDEHGITGDLFLEDELEFLDNITNNIDRNNIINIINESENDCILMKDNNIDLNNSNTYKIIYVYCDDWEGVYVNNELEYEGHRIDSDIWLNLISKYKSFDETYESYSVDNEYMSLNGNFPYKFDEFPKEVLLK